MFATRRTGGKGDTPSATLRKALAHFDKRDYEAALPLFLAAEPRLSPPGVGVYVLQCLLRTGRSDDLLPYVESALDLPANRRNAELWRLAGLLYLKYRQSVGEACRAWQTSIALDPRMLDRYPDLSIAGRYERMALAGMEPLVRYVDLDTGQFAVEFVPLCELEAAS